MRGHNKLLAALLALVAACSTPRAPEIKTETPVAKTTATDTAITAEEHARTIHAMKPPKRARPVIAVVAENDGTETTDFIVPYAVLAASGSAEVCGSDLSCPDPGASLSLR